MRIPLLLACISTSIGTVSGFVLISPQTSRSREVQTRQIFPNHQQQLQTPFFTIRRHLASSSSDSLPIPCCKIGDLLSDLPTPSLLLELSLAEKAVGEHNDQDKSLDQRLALQDSNLDCFEGALFVHTQVVDTSTRDTMNRQQGSGASIVIGELDVPYDALLPGAFLGIGLANHHVGGYYWARGMGIGASLPAHGIEVRACVKNDEDDDHDNSDDSRSELYWLKRGPGLNALETTEESSNSNDGKRSEWADFLATGDTVQLVPKDASALLLQSSSSSEEEGFTKTLIGVRRIGRPLGADPIVEKIWVRSAAGGWVVPT